MDNQTNKGKTSNRVKELYGNVKDYVKEYCDCSSIQGLSYLTKDISLLEGLWWAIVFALCLGGCSFMIKEIVDKWNQSPVLVTLATYKSPIYHVPFPAATICPETKIKRQCLNYSSVMRMTNEGQEDKISEQERSYFDYMAPLCRLENHVNSTREEPLDDYADFLEKCKSVDLKDVFCQFMGKNHKCSKILTPIITDNGLCYTFNMLDVRDIYSEVNQMKHFREEHRNPDWDVEKGYAEATNKSVYPRRSFGTGAQKSLIVTILTKKSDVYSSCQDFSLQGLKVSLHIPSSIPRPNQVSFPVGFDELVAVSVVPSLTVTTNKIKGYDPHKRQCFFERERKLKYFKRYTQSNCNMECWTNYTIQECGCVHFYMPRDASSRICGPAKMKCLNDAEGSFAVSNFPLKYRLGKQSKGTLDNHCDCLPSCADLTYVAEISRVNWDWSNPSAADARYLKKYFSEYHASAIKVFFKTSHFLSLEKSELYGITSFLSNAGGILGLFLGFSLFSLIEIVYFLSVRLIENYRKYGLWLGKEEQAQ